VRRSSIELGSCEAKLTGKIRYEFGSVRTSISPEALPVDETVSRLEVGAAYYTIDIPERVTWIENFIASNARIK
jgi:hypothetical protein